MQVMPVATLAMNFFIWQFAASQVGAAALPGHVGTVPLIMATCRFGDSLVAIKETIESLTIQLASVDRHADTEDNDTRTLDVTRKSMDEYRERVVRLTNVTEGQSPVPVLKRYRRDIEQVIESATGAKDGQAIPSSLSTMQPHESKDELTKLEPQYALLVASCLQQYRILKRVILFEHFLEHALSGRFQVQDMQKQSDEVESSKPNLLQVAACKVSRGMNHFVNQLAILVCTYRRFLFFLCGLLVSLLLLIILMQPRSQKVQKSTGNVNNKAQQQHQQPQKPASLWKKAGVRLLKNGEH